MSSKLPNEAPQIKKKFFSPRSSLEFDPKAIYYKLHLDNFKGEKNQGTSSQNTKCSSLIGPKSYSNDKSKKTFEANQALRSSAVALRLSKTKEEKAKESKMKFGERKLFSNGSLKASEAKTGGDGHLKRQLEEKRQKRKEEIKNEQGKRPKMTQVAIKESNKRLNQAKKKESVLGAKEVKGSALKTRDQGNQEENKKEMVLSHSNGALGDKRRERKSPHMSFSQTHLLGQSRTVDSSKEEKSVFQQEKNVSQQKESDQRKLSKNQSQFKTSKQIETEANSNPNHPGTLKGTQRKSGIGSQLTERKRNTQNRVSGLSKSDCNVKTGIQSRSLASLKSFDSTILPANEKEALNLKLEKIFKFYANFGDRFNTSKLKLKNFHLMMSDSMVLDEERLPKSRLDLLFFVEDKQKTGLSFEEFISLLVVLSRAKYPEYKQSDALVFLLSSHFLPLYEIIMGETVAGNDENLFREPIHEGVFEVIRDSFGRLFTLYQFFFKYEFETETETKSEKNKKASLTAFLFFTKEFGICPGCMTKREVISLWDFCLKQPESQTIEIKKQMFPKNQSDSGLLFKFSMFLSALARISTFLKSENELTPSEKILKLLDKMEESPGNQRLIAEEGGTLNTNKRLSRHQSVDGRCTTLKSESHSRNKKESPSVVVSSFLPRKNEETVSPTLSKSSNRLSSPGSAAPVFQSQAIDEKIQDVIIYKQLNEIFNAFHNDLFTIFVSYCSLGEALNTTSMKSSKFIKLLRDSGLLSSSEDFSNCDSHRLEEYKNKRKTSSFSTFSKKKVSSSQPETPSTKVTKPDKFSLCIFNEKSPLDSPKAEKGLSQEDCEAIFNKIISEKHKSQKASRTLTPDRRVPSPKICQPTYLSKNKEKGSTSSKKLEWNEFLKAIELVSQRILPDSPLASAVRFVVQEKFLKIPMSEQDINRTIGVSHLKQMAVVLQEEKVVKLLKVLQKEMKVIFKVYADTKGNMNINGFLSFCTDFSIFPKILSKMKVSRIFYSLSSLWSELKEGKEKSVAIEQTETELIGLHLFIECIGLLGTFVPNPKGIQCSSHQKVPIPFNSF